MKRLADILKAVCSIATAVVIYMSVMKAVEGNENILLYIIASIFALSITVAMFLVSSLSSRVSNLERFARTFYEDDYEDGESFQKECPVCHAAIKDDEEMCPYCKNDCYTVNEQDNAVFATDDPKYNGTDYSNEEYVSAHISDDANK